MPTVTETIDKRLTYCKEGEAHCLCPKCDKCNYACYYCGKVPPENAGVLTFKERDNDKVKGANIFCERNKQPVIRGLTVRGGM